jgi:hypothetical protein
MYNKIQKGERRDLSGELLCDVMAVTHGHKKSSPDKSEELSMFSAAALLYQA